MNENGHKETPLVASPKCAKCNASPYRFAENMVLTNNGNMIYMLWCADCGVIESINFLGQKKLEIPSQLAGLSKNGRIVL